MSFFSCFHKIENGKNDCYLVYQNMISKIVRGNQLLVVSEPPACIAQKMPSTDFLGRDSHPKVGDKLWVSSRKSNGWIRVKNARTKKVTSLRVGPWIKKHNADCQYETPESGSSNLNPKADVFVLPSIEVPVTPPPLARMTPPGSCESIDQVIRKSQVDSLLSQNARLDNLLMNQSAKLAELESLVADQAECLRLDVALKDELQKRPTQTYVNEIYHEMDKLDEEWKDKLERAQNQIIELREALNEKEIYHKTVIQEKDEQISHMKYTIEDLRAAGIIRAVIHGDVDNELSVQY